MWDLRSNALRPDGWTSADAAGLPILPGLVRYEEVAAGRIDHAIRFTAPRTQRAALWPARHVASSSTDPDLPPMGAWFRLRADFDTSRLAPQARVVAEALKVHGMILADNGSSLVHVRRPRRALGQRRPPDAGQPSPATTWWRWTPPR